MTLDPKTLLYSPTHEWVHVDGPVGAKIATVGISDFAVKALTDLIHIELPEVGRAVQAKAPLGEVESVKAVSDIYSPVDGTVTESNTPLASHLETLNTDPYGAGWLVKIRIANDAGLADLLDYAAYQKQCEEEG
jgi:glycine cleavage system H protein